MNEQIPGFNSAAAQTFPNSFQGLQAQNAQQDQGMSPEMLQMLAIALRSAAPKKQEQQTAQAAPYGWMQGIGDAVQGISPGIISAYGAGT